ncbi:MAG TPA: hypothetical protein VEL47_05260 [Myxococcota bacterium]|nr:hypothetical protein [Myxococcota bacterium]
MNSIIFIFAALSSSSLLYAADEEASSFEETKGPISFTLPKAQQVTYERAEIPGHREHMQGIYEKELNETKELNNIDGRESMDASSGKLDAILTPSEIVKEQSGEQMKTEFSPLLSDEEMKAQFLPLLNDAKNVEEVMLANGISMYLGYEIAAKFVEANGAALQKFYPEDIYADNDSVRLKLEALSKEEKTAARQAADEVVNTIGNNFGGRHSYRLLKRLGYHDLAIKAIERAAQTVKGDEVGAELAARWTIYDILLALNPKVIQKITDTSTTKTPEAGDKPKKQSVMDQDSRREPSYVSKEEAARLQKDYDQATYLNAAARRKLEKLTLEKIGLMKWSLGDKAEQQKSEEPRT